MRRFAARWLARAVSIGVWLSAAAGAAAQTAPPNDPPAQPSQAPLTPQSPFTWQHATDDPFGYRSKLENAGVTFDVLLTADYSKNFQGGIDTAGDAFRHLLEATVLLDTSKIFHLSGAGNVFLDFQQQNGTNASLTLTGDTQFFDNIDADGRTQIAQLWYEQKLFNDILRLKVGKVDANSEFSVIPSALEFINSTFAYTPTILDFPTYPDPAMSLNVFVEPKHFYGKFGWYDGAFQEGIQTGEHGPATFWGPPSSWFLIAEGGAKWTVGGAQLPGKLGVGGWYATGPFALLSPGHPTTPGVITPGRPTTDGTGGAYAILDQQLHRQHPEDPNDTSGLGMFLQIGYAHPSVAIIDNQIGAGLSWMGVVPHRSADIVGLAATYAHFSQRNGFQYDHELAVETFYKLQITPWASVKPDLQFIQHPGGEVRGRAGGNGAGTVRFLASGILPLAAWRIGGRGSRAGSHSHSRGGAVLPRPLVREAASGGLRRFAVRLAFEAVVVVRVAAAAPEDERRAEIRGEEEDSPAFALADVDALVGARARQRVGIDAEHDVAECHRGGAAGKPEACRAAEKPGGETAVEFEDAIDPMRAAAGEERGEEEDQPDAAGRQDPDVEQGAEETHDHSL
jgi:porin